MKQEGAVISLIYFTAKRQLRLTRLVPDLSVSHWIANYSKQSGRDNWKEEVGYGCRQD